VKVFFAQQRASGIEPSVIFTSPGVQLKHVKIDWLHMMDLGNSQTVLGNVLWESLVFFPGNTIKERVSALWDRMQEFYRRTKPPSRLQKLTLEMLRMPGKAPKLRGKAGETRYLVPFGLEIAQEFAPKSFHAATVCRLMESLMSLYTLLDSDPFPAKQAAATSLEFCLIFQALATEAELRGHGAAWRLKPKLHLLQELLEYDCIEHGSSPRTFWTYYDESWGAWVADAAARRGGHKAAATIAANVLNRFRAWAKPSD
jgi:hypothetical protein